MPTHSFPHRIPLILQKQGEVFKTNMVLPKEHILKYMSLYKLHFGVDISYECAQEEGLRLMRFISSVKNVSGKL